MTPHDTCKACQGQWPAAAAFIGDCGQSRAYLFDDQFFPGWTVLVLKRHVTELFGLSPAERQRLMEEVSAVSQILATAYDAKKMNYELLGNQLPHMHWHLIPRRPDDPAPLEPVWRVPHHEVRLTPDEQLATQRLRTLLGSALPGFHTTPGDPAPAPL